MIIRLILLLLSSSSFSFLPPNSDLQISVGTAGPQPQLQISVGTAGPQPLSPNPGLNLTHCRTSTASSRSQWALPDLNRERQISVSTAGPQLRALDRRNSTEWALPDLIRERQISVPRESNVLVWTMFSSNERFLPKRCRLHLTLSWHRQHMLSYIWPRIILKKKTKG